MHPARGGGALTATATVVERGRNIVHLEARMTGGDGRLAATPDSVLPIRVTFGHGRH
jgi:acyl-coenzyme A thioesterase PaaI-like protein